MKLISIWAYHHKWTARLVLILAYILLNIIGWFFGEALSYAGIQLPIYLSYLFAIPFFTAMFLYPSRRRKNEYRNFYQFQKAMDGVLVTVSFLLIICFTNQFSSLSPIHQPLQASFLSGAEKPAPKTIRPFKKLKRDAQRFSFYVKHWKFLKKNVQNLKQAYKDTGKGGKIALIILASLLAVGLLALVMGLSCNLSCSGNEGAALLLLLLGTGLIVFLLARVIRSINRGPRKKPVEPTSL